MGSMKHVDMRKLPAAAQEERRRQVIGLRQAGQTYDAIAAQVGLSPTGVFDICKRYAERGTAGLKTGPRGPEPGHGRFIDADQEAEACRLIQRHTPDELDLPFALWSRAAVRELIRQRFGVRLAVRTMGTYLARWGFTAQKPLRRAYEQDPAAVRRWLRRDYPAIAARAKTEGGSIFWGDETGLRSDDVRGRGYAPPGRTPEVRVNHRRTNLGLPRRVQQALLIGLAPARLADKPLGTLGREALADVDHPGPAQPDLLGDRPVGQAALPQPDHLPPALLLGRRRQLAHVHVPHHAELARPPAASRTPRPD